MNNLMKVEMKKLKKSLAFKVVFAILIVSLLMSLAVFLAVKLISVEEIETTLALTMGGLNGYSSFLMTISTTASDYLMYAIIVISIMICGDFSSRTLQGELSAGYTRMQVALSRFLLGVIIYTIYQVVYVLIYVGGMTALFGFGKTLTPMLVLGLLGRFMLGLIAGIAMLSIYWLIIMTVKTVGVAIGVSIPLYLFGSTFIVLLQSNFEIAGNIVKWTPYGIFDIVSANTIDAFDLVRFFVVVAVTIVVMICANNFLFKNAELK